MNYYGLDLKTMSIGVFIDAAFANNVDLTSQLGFLTALMDEKGTVIVVNYGSLKCKRVTLSALAAELYAMMYGFDQSFVIHKAVEEFFEKRVPLRIFTDSLSLFESLTSLNTTSEKRLLIDLSILRESYERREIADVFWIPGDQNLADGLTKKSACDAIVRLMDTITVNITPQAWIERKPRDWSKAD